jgi:predicted dithiol-disulfide oxidoreductase (DUF899 family)
MAETVAHPKIASRAEWLAARKELLAHEKDVTKHRDRVNAARRRLPMVRLDKAYVFDGPGGKRTLLDLFAGKRQLIVYHFMFGPEWENGCPGCTNFANWLGDISGLAARDTAFAMISRAPIAKLLAYKAKKGWELDWYSSFGGDFNYDFHTTLDDAKAPREYNYRDAADLDARADEAHFRKGEQHAISVFFRLGDDIHHTYSAFARGTEALCEATSLLDITPYGHQEAFEESPTGWPQKPTYGA